MIYASLLLLTLAVATPRLIVDLNTDAAPQSVEASLVGSLGASTLFSLTTEAGAELWISDASGARLLKDINPGTPSSYPRGIGVLGGRVLFTADDGVHGTELWSTDGTGQGTAMVKDVHPGPGGVVYGRTAIVGSTLLFLGNDGTNGYELWKSDGTAAGTSLVLDAVPGSYGFDPDSRGFVVMGSNIYWGSYNEIWTSDGTPAGTRLVYEVDQSSHTRDVSPFLVDGKLFFTSGYAVTYTFDLYVSDGTTAGTRKLGATGGYGGGPGMRLGSRWIYGTWSGGNGSYTVSVKATDGNTVSSLKSVPSSSSYIYSAGSDPSWPVGFFFAPGAQSSATLYVTDGTAPGTAVLHSLVDLQSSVFRLGSSYVYLGKDTTGAAVFSWDGDPANAPVVVKRLSAITDSSAKQFGGRLYFIADDGTSGAEPWATDGTATGTLMLADANPGTGGSKFDFQAPSFAWGPELIFAVTPIGGTGVTAWRTDGTSAGTFPLGSFAPKVSFERGQDAITIADEGGAAVLREVPPIGTPPAPVTIWSPPNASSEPYEWTSSGSFAWFGALESGQWNPTSLFRTDGTVSGTKWLIRVSGQSLGDFQLLGSRLVYTSGGGVWASDGTEAGSYSVSSATDMAILGTKIVIGRSKWSSGYELAVSDGSRNSASVLQALSKYPHGFVSAGSYVYFLQSATSYGYNLFRTTGTTASGGLLQLTTERVSEPVGFGASVAFVVDDEDLWTSSGTATGTKLVPGGAGLEPQELIGVGSKLYFTAQEAATGRELWALDATGLRRLSDFEPGAAGTTKLLAAAAEGTGAILVVQTGAGRFLVRTDGTPAGTALLAEVPGATWLRTIDDVLYFDCAMGAEGLELCALKRGGTQPALLADINPGPAPSSPGPVVRVGNELFLTGYLPGVGREPVAVPLQVDSTPPQITEQVTGTLGENGFYVSDVAVSFEVLDAESFATEGAGCAGGTVTADTRGRTFTCVATSKGGSTTRNVPVRRDTAPPTLFCPGTLKGIEGQPVTFSVSATDAIDDAPRVQTSVASGTVFALGTTAVDVVATDAAGNETQCSFDITVEAAPPDAGHTDPGNETADGGGGGMADGGIPHEDPADASSSGCGCASAGSGAAPGLVMLTLLAAIGRRRAPRPKQRR